MPDKDETPPATPKFDFDLFPENTLFHERRDGPRRDRRATDEPAGGGTSAEAARPPAERRVRKDRRRRIDPTTFEKQYTDDEMEFMNAMQRFKVQSGKHFPSHGEVIKVAVALGYRKAVLIDEEGHDQADGDALPDDEAEDSAVSAETGSLDLRPTYPSIPN